MLKKIFKYLTIAIVIFVIVLLVNTFRFVSKQSAILADPAPDVPKVALENFQQAIRYQTISFDDPALFDSTQFIGFRNFLEQQYPTLHRALTREIIEGFSLLYTWKGQDERLKPIILMAHQDVVPIEAASRDMWTVDPFEGVVRDGYIWGRGTVDDKINLIAIMEVVEKLVREGVVPERTVYLAFGHDEEILGKGALRIAQLLKERDVVADLVLDEGGIITRDKIPGLNKTVSLLGTSEKGYMSVELSVEKGGGHSSMPEPETAIDILSNAIINLRKNPTQPDLSPSTLGFVEHVGPEMPFLYKVIFANTWLFKSFIIDIYSESAPGSAMVNTTMVPTLIEAGIKENVIPTVAKATVNFRMLPGMSSSDVIGHIRRSIRDERVRIEPLPFLSEPSSVTAVKSFGYKKIEHAIKKSIPESITTPFLVIGATDSRHFSIISDNIIKFSPMIDPIGFHGIDERVSLESFQYALWFYEQLLRDLK